MGMLTTRNRIRINLKRRVKQTRRNGASSTPLPCRMCLPSCRASHSKRCVVWHASTFFFIALTPPSYPHPHPDCVIVVLLVVQPVRANVGQQNNPHAGEDGRQAGCCLAGWLASKQAGRHCNNNGFPSFPLVLAGEKPAAMQHPAKSAADAQITFNFNFVSCQTAVFLVLFCLKPLLLPISLNLPTISSVT